MIGLGLVVICSIFGVLDSQPAKDNGQASNLMYTFGSQEEIPAAFFDLTPSQARASNETSQTRRVYRACQDGSGGLCVPIGECPPDLKPETFSENACEKDLECCFGPPSSDKTCSSRGGECMSLANCGRQPVYKEAVDCDHSKGHICCVLTR